MMERWWVLLYGYYFMVMEIATLLWCVEHANDTAAGGPHLSVCGISKPMHGFIWTESPWAYAACNLCMQSWRLYPQHDWTSENSIRRGCLCRGIWEGSWAHRPCQDRLSAALTVGLMIMHEQTCTSNMCIDKCNVERPFHLRFFYVKLKRSLGMWIVQTPMNAMELYRIATFRHFRPRLPSPLRHRPSPGLPHLEASLAS